jgi:hypothetical protein
MTTKRLVRATPDTLFFVVKNRLSDGSHTYDVMFGEHRWHAEDQEHARELAQGMADLINEHTVDLANVVDET